MRTSTLVWMIAALSVTAVQGEEFPYTAYVNGDDVYVRSGPGQNYYPTSKLPLGQAVEVYRHDPGGWYAVRPPAGSFCWVAARYLKPGPNNIAVVTGDRVVARVGSEFSDIRDVIQVRLDRGEEVEVLDAKMLDIAEGGEKWAKVAPVAGEFRWVLGKFLDRTPPEPTLLAEPGRRNMLIEDKTVARYRQQESINDEDGLTDATGANGPTQASFEEDVEEGANEGRMVGAFRPVSRSTNRLAPTETRTAVEPRAERTASYEEDRDDVATAQERLPLEQVSSRPTVDGNTVNGDAFQAELDAIDLEVSRMVVEEPTVWSFTELKTRAEISVSRAQTALERGRARLVLGKIQRFEQIRDRYEAVAQAQADTDQLNTLAAGSRLDGTSSFREPAERFDGTGRLIAVVSPRVGSPQFALTDEAGNVKAYITAAPGVGLRQYLGRQIGISGTRGYIPEYKARHLTAKRVTLLDQPLVR